MDAPSLEHAIQLACQTLEDLRMQLNSHTNTTIVQGASEIPEVINRQIVSINNLAAHLKRLQEQQQGIGGGIQAHSTQYTSMGQNHAERKEQEVERRENSDETVSVVRDAGSTDEKERDDVNESPMGRIVEVPVRPRTARTQQDKTEESSAYQGASQSDGTTTQVFFNMELPKTPFISTKCDDPGNSPEAPMTDVPETIARAIFSLSRTLPAVGPTQNLNQPTPGAPASTPIAAEVLAGMCAPQTQSKAFEGFSATNNKNKSASATASNTRNASRIAANNLAAVPRRAAARRSTKTVADLLPTRAKSRPGEVTSCEKGCNCKRSACLKLYCECFAAGGFCSDGCTCQNCSNTELHVDLVHQARDAILSKDPEAFDTKVTEEEGHRKGCRCKRSRCLKKYCECYNAGVQCNSEVCQCVGCLNGPSSAANVPLEHNVAKRPVLTKTNFVENTSPNIQGSGLGIANHSMPMPGVQASPFNLQKAIRQLVGHPDIAAAMAKQMQTPRNGVPGSPRYACGPSTNPESHTFFSTPRHKELVKNTTNTFMAPQNVRTAVSCHLLPKNSTNYGESGASNPLKRTKRPRRAASGGVLGAVAAETSTWGLDDVSPPLRRSSAIGNGVQVPNSIDRKQRNELLRKALHNEIFDGAGQDISTKKPMAVPFDSFSDKISEVDAVNALVTLNNTT